MTYLSRFNVFVEGKPVPQGSKKAFKRGNQIVLVEANPALKAWRATVAAGCAQELHNLNLVEPFTDAVHVVYEFIIPRPSTVKRVWPSVAPDLDKLIRAVNDSLTDARVWSDDSLVVSLEAVERYAFDEPPGVWITITPK
jgi:Holliday junction resolvase RusA-like endonuclease